MHSKAKILHDVQSEVDDREIDIDQVGVSGLRTQITVMDRNNGQQHTVAEVTLSVNLPRHFKGTHMSRFIEVFSQHQGEVTMRTIPKILADLKKKLSAESARVELSFPYFLERHAPVSRAVARMDYTCRFVGEINGKADDFILDVTVPVTSVCPCSKTISDYGAHNQRGSIQMQVRSIREKDGFFALVWIEELIDIAEKSASAPVYALLKRSDERHVTMQAFDKPVFVEDMVRNVAMHLKADSRIAWFRVRVENHESIHNHNAFARVEWSRKKH